MSGAIAQLAGLVGSRRTELLETIFGIAHHDKGEMEIRRISSILWLI